jgi:hypothetical protein
MYILMNNTYIYMYILMSNICMCMCVYIYMFMYIYLYEICVINMIHSKVMSSVYVPPVEESICQSCENIGWC